MTWIILGVFLWAATHFLPSLAADFRQRQIGRFGLPVWRAVFALLVLGALGSMILGWNMAAPQMLYTPVAGAKHAASLLMLLAFILFTASVTQNNFKRGVRHPQLAAVVLWGTAHLLANGDARALIQFGGLALWALLQIGLLNRRQGEWKRPEPTPLKNDTRAMLIGGVLYAVFVLYVHAWLFGVRPV